MSSKVISCYLLLICYFIHLFLHFASPYYSIFSFSDNMDKDIYALAGLPYVFGLFLVAFIYFSVCEKAVTNDSLNKGQRKFSYFEKFLFSFLLFILLIQFFICLISVLQDFLMILLSNPLIFIFSLFGYIIILILILYALFLMLLQSAN